MTKSKLFQPFTTKTLTIPNRIVMAPMTRRKSANGVPGEDVAAYYRRRVEGGVGLIVTEGTTIDRPGASNNPSIPNFHSSESLDGWRNVVEEVHAAGGKIAPQLWHLGLERLPSTGPNPMAASDSPSGLSVASGKIGKPMTEAEISDTIMAFAKAAGHSKALGFDAVQVHAAHGYLIDQFFWGTTNVRSDRYGGNPVERTRFATELVKAMRAEVGEDFPIMLRFSQWKVQDYNARLADNPDELLAFLEPLIDAGVDIFDCSTRRFWTPEFEGSSLNLAGWTRRLTGKPTITVGSVGLDGSHDFLQFVRGGQGQGVERASLAELLLRLNDNEFDLVAVGRALLSDADWARKVQEDREDNIRPFSREHLDELI